VTMTSNGRVVAEALVNPSWLREHDARVKAQALRDAAEEYSNGHQADKPHDNYRVEVPRWLRERAERISTSIHSRSSEEVPDVV